MLAKYEYKGLSTYCNIRPASGCKFQSKILWFILGSKLYKLDSVYGINFRKKYNCLKNVLHEIHLLHIYGDKEWYLFRNHLLH